MPARRLDVLDVREIVRRMQHGETDRRIARDLELSRNTVRKYRKWARREGLLARGQELPGPKDFQDRLERAAPPCPAGPASSAEPYRAFIVEKRKEGVELTALLGLVRERGFQGSYSSLRRFVAKLEPKRPEVFVRVETAMGEEAQVDFGAVSSVIDADTGKPRKAWVFVMTLSWSRHQYAEVVFDQRVETWIALHVRALEYFQGVVKRITLDNLKAGIVKASIHDPEVQRSYRELAEHYGFLISPCRPATPRHKGKVESGVHYVARNALAGRKFSSLAAINGHLARWVEEVAGRRVHGTTQEVPLERFEKEREHLAPLPRTRYEVVTWKRAKLHPDCHVVFDYSYYSAPHRFVGQTMLVRATPRRVEIFLEHERVSSHARATRRGQRLTNQDHYPPDKVLGFLPEPHRLRAAAHRVGPRTEEFIERLLGDRPLDRLRGAQGSLRLEKKYGAERLEAACDRALRFDELRYSTVKGILERGLEHAEVEPAAMPLPEQSRFARSPEEFLGRKEVAS